MRLSGNRLIDGAALVTLLVSLTLLTAGSAGYSGFGEYGVMPPVTASLLVVLALLLVLVERFLALSITVEVLGDTRDAPWRERDLGLRLQISKVSLQQAPKYLIRAVSLTGLLAVGVMFARMSGWTDLGLEKPPAVQLPAPHTLLCTFLLFLAALAATYQKVSSLLIIQLAGLVVIVVALSALVGHLFGTRSPVMMGFGGVSGMAVMALPTAVCLLCLGGGFMVNAGRDYFLAVPVRLFSAFSAIALLLLSLGGLPLLLGWFIAGLDWGGRYGRDSALALLVVLNILLQLPVILHVARKLFFREHQLRQAVNSLQEAVAQKDDLTARLRELSRRDPLTGLFNRRAFEEELRKVWRRSQRGRQTLSLLYVDIDFFKAFNDYYGHPAGDACLIAVAGVLNAAVKREGDMVVRLGGEEFVVLLPDTGQDGALAVAARLHRLMQLESIDHVQSSIATKLTVSIGVSSLLPRRGDDPGMLVANADKALYQAKSEGRNRTFVAPVASIQPDQLQLPH